MKIDINLLGFMNIIMENISIIYDINNIFYNFDVFNF